VKKLSVWIDDGFLIPKDPVAQRVRTVILSQCYEELADEIRESPEYYKYLLGNDD
jgi:hypothetical protein